MSGDAGAVEDGAPAFDLSQFISRFIALHAEGKENCGKCPFCDTRGHSLKVGAVWRAFCCGAHEIAGNDAPGFYACWTDSTREEAIAKLGNGAGLPDVKPIEQRPLKRLPFWGWRELDKPELRDKAVWIHELSGAVLVWRELLPERVHLGIISSHAGPWYGLGIVANRRCVLVPENNLESHTLMAGLAAALYRAGHKQVMCLALGLDERYGTRELPGPDDDVLKWAKARSKPYPKPNGEEAPEAPPLKENEIEEALEEAVFPPEFIEAKAAQMRARIAQKAAQVALQARPSAQRGDDEPGIPATPPERQAAQAAAAPITATAVTPKTWDGLALILGAKGEIKACEHNAKELMGAAKQYDCLHFDKFLYRTRLGERDWSDADDRDAVCWLQSQHRVAGFTLNQARTAAMALANARAQDSLFEFVMGLPEWDGTPRIELAFTDAWGAEDTSLTRRASRNFFIALHARAVKPGAQVDNLWAIEGPQGKLKSASLRALGEHFHAEISAQIGTTDFLRELRGVWIAELSELDSLRGREASTVKRLLSAPADRFVEKFEKHATAYPRRAVAVATTNEATYWQDSTGARRLIPIRVGTINLQAIHDQRLQWFAEARHEYQAGATWWEFPEGIEGEQEARQAVDPWEDTLRGYITDGRMDPDGYAKPWPEGWIASAEIMSDWLKLPASQQGKSSSVRLGHVMRRLGYRPRKSTDGNQRGWATRNTDNTDNTDNEVQPSDS